MYQTKRRFVLGNLEAALSEELRPRAKRKLSGNEQALLIATACSKPPVGWARVNWSASPNMPVSRGKPSAALGRKRFEALA